MEPTEPKKAFDRDGFVIVRGWLPQTELASLRENLDRYLRDVVPNLPAEEAFYHERSRPETLKQLHRMDVDPFFDAYRRHPRWSGLARDLLEEDVDALPPEWFNKPPGVPHETPPHQDNYYFNLVPPKVLTLWLALDPIDEENGCLRYVRGSHRAGVRPHAPTAVLGFSQGITDFGAADEALEVSIELAPGDVVAHHGETIHRADANRSRSRHRRAFAIVFRGKSCRRDEAQFARYAADVRRQRDELT